MTVQSAVASATTRPAPLCAERLAICTDDAAAAVCARHLRRLGARVATDVSAATIVLADADSAVRDRAPAGAIVCEIERHRLADGAWIASETTAQAALALPDYVGAPGERPERTGSDIAASVGGFLAVAAICAQRRAGVPPDAPVVLRTSGLRALATLKSLTLAARSRPDAWTGTHVVSREKQPDSGYATADGWITLDFAQTQEQDWLRFVQELGLDAETVERLRPRFIETVGWGDDVDHARPVYESRLRQMDSVHAMDLIRRCGGSSVPFLTADECLEHPQAHAVGLAESFADGTPFRLSRRGDAPARRRGPRPMPGRPLAGVRVVDLGIGGVGPFAPMLLAQLGADVVKVEPPSDFVHSIGPHADGLSTTYLACNNGKRSVRIDLKDPRDRDRLWELIADADVINENFRPGVLDRLGFGWDTVAEINPSIVYASTSGYGWDGPLAREPCTDPHAQAFAGFAMLNADADGVPRRIRYIGFIDVVTSTVIAEGICSALVLRERQGGSVRMQTSMMHAIVETTRPAGGPRSHPDGLYRAADGFVALTCRDEVDWERLVEALGDPAELRRRDFADGASRGRNAAALRVALDDALSTRAARAWVIELSRRRIPCARLVHDDELMVRRDYWDAGLLVDLCFSDRTLTTGGPPVRFAADAPRLRAPLPGEHDGAFRRDPSAFWRIAPPTTESE